MLTIANFTFETGLGGRTTVLESGGVPYLLPLVNREKVYDMKEMANAVGYDSCLVIGAGAGPWPFVGVNSEVSYPPPQKKVSAQKSFLECT